MAALFSESEMKQEIITFLRAVHEDPVATLGPDLNDYAKIGSLMTDLPRVEATLSLLNSQLRVRAASEKMIVKTDGRESLKHEADGTVKHHKILTDLLAASENAAGFNQGIGHRTGGLPRFIQGLTKPFKPSKPSEPYRPSGPATLTGLVKSQDFKNCLLKHAYHWKDSGFGGSHGEFTHRLQWYVITKEYELGNLVLGKRPVELFKRLAEPETFGEGEDNLWVLLVDYAGSAVGDVELSKRISSTYRKPETLHAFLKKEETQQREDLWVLSQLIAGRSKKRTNSRSDVNANYQKEMAKLDSDHQMADKNIFFKPAHEKRWGNG
ncbi:MAG: hypothetical protein INR62_04295 [Rhodospirillales bacterium]|nr:hypothetical protein [Acetobacter sp.]